MCVTPVKPHVCYAGHAMSRAGVRQHLAMPVEDGLTSRNEPE